MFSIEFYELASGRRPAEEFIRGLTADQEEDALHHLEILKNLAIRLACQNRRRWVAGFMNCEPSLMVDISDCFISFRLAKSCILNSAKNFGCLGMLGAHHQVRATLRIDARTMLE